MGLFSRKPKRATTPGHGASVVYVYERGECAYYTVTCDCGFVVDVVDSDYPNPAVEAHMAQAALAHDPLADTTVFFPMDKPPTA